ncbi:MAG: hypothetical protein CMH56_07030, partial [Myxococcales bacterium]|nr:hypothetical protein [Myxococcales bacterium]
FFAFDSWDGEVGYLKYNNTYIWQRSHFHDPQNGENQCGRAHDDKNGILNAFEQAYFVHDGGTFSLTFGSTLNEASFNESWGLNNLVIKASSATACAGRTMWGGYQVCGVDCWAEKVLYDLTPGEYYLSFDFFHVDSWDDETGWLQFNQRQIWSRSHYSGDATENLCGRGGAFYDNGIFLDRVTVKIMHSGGDAVFRWGSDLDEAAINESWGIDNIRLDREVSSVLRHRYNWQDNQPYFWRVRAQTGSTPGPWSNIKEFLIDSGQPSAFNLLAPSDGTDPLTKKPTLTWEPSLNRGTSRGCLTMTGGVCNNDADCVGTCVGGICSEDTASFTCTSDAQCEGTCNGGTCSEHQTCTDNSDCNGFCGGDGYCTDTCDANNDCATGYACIKGQCSEPGTVGGDCDEKSDCQGGYTCENSICVSVSGLGLVVKDTGGNKLTKTFASAGAANKWSLSYWAKMGNPASNPNVIAGAKGSNNFEYVRFGFKDKRASVELKTTTAGASCTQTTEFAFANEAQHYWHHYLWVLDTAQESVNGRLRLYIDGQERTSWVANQTCVTQNQNVPFWNGAGALHTLGADPLGTHNFDGVLAMVHFVDGHTLSPSDFALMQSQHWAPKRFTGAYGSTGFHLDFSNTYNFGQDKSQLNNHFIAENFAAHAAIYDTPDTDFAVFDTNRRNATSNSLSGSNLHTSSNGATGLEPIGANLPIRRGNWYYEFKVIAAQTQQKTPVLGLAKDGFDYTTTPTMGTNWTPADSTIYGVESVSPASSTQNFNSGAVVGVAVAVDAGTLWYHVDGTWGNGAVASSPSQYDASKAYQVAILGPHDLAAILSDGVEIVANFGQDATFGGRRLGVGQFAPDDGIGRFAYPVPKGYQALAKVNQGRRALRRCGDNSQCEGVCLIETQGGAAINLLSDATITASSTFTNWPLSHLTDGDASTAWRSDPTSGDAVPQVTIDLGKLVYIDAVQLQGVNSSYGSQTIRVAVTADYLTGFTRTLAFSSANNSDWLNFDFSGILARVIKIYSETTFSTTAGLSEIRVVKGNDGFCANQQTIGGSCDENADCEPGLECVAAVCQKEPEAKRQSVKLNDADQSYFNITPSAAGNSKTWTFSTWFKRGNESANDQALLSARLDNSNQADIFLGGSGTSHSSHLGVTLKSAGVDYGWYFNGLPSDNKDWHHLLVTLDTDNRLGETNRPRAYLDGIEVTDIAYTGSAAGGLPANQPTAIFQVGAPIRLGASVLGGNHYDGYLAEVQMIDGKAALLEEVTDRVNILVPKKFGGDYGPNGLYLSFVDSMATESASAGERLHLKSFVSKGSKHHIVQTQGMSFSPSSLNIRVGDSVTFINTGGGNHNVNGTTATFPDNPASFGNAVGTDWTFTHTFTAAGVYNYQCDPHGPAMSGSITVTSSGDEGQTYTVQTQGMSFSPSSLNIRVGDSVTFINTEGVNHNVNGTTATFPGNPASFGNAVGTNWTFTHTFTAAGVYNYQCDPHGPAMSGNVSVSSDGEQDHILRDVSNSAHVVQSTGGPEIKGGVGSPFDASAQALFFDGQDSFLTVPDSDDFYFALEPFTLETWVYLTSASTGVDITQYDDPENYWRFGVSTDGLTFESLAGTGGANFSLANAGTIELSRWTHVAVQRAPNTFALYIDGQNVTALGTTSVVFANQHFGNQNGPLWIGRDHNSNSSVGYIYDLRLTVNENAYFINDFSPPQSSFGTGGIGKDSSGRDNHVGLKNIHGYDLILDHPQQNFAVWSLTDNRKGDIDDGSLALSEDGLKNNSTQATMSKSNGKWYFEVMVEEVGSASDEFQVGIRSDSNKIKSLVSNNDNELVYDNYGTVNTHTSYLGTPYESLQSRVPPWRINDVVGVAFDIDGDSIAFYLNGVRLTSQRFVGLPGSDWSAWAFNDQDSVSWRANFGQDPSFGGRRVRDYYYADSFNFGRFAYQPPNGYQPLSSEAECLIDTDGDGTNDCYDGCPNDASLRVRGLCGCAPCLTADKCYGVRDSSFDEGDVSAFTPASTNAASGGPIALNSAWYAFGQDTDSGSGACNNIQISVAGGVGTANHNGAAETECRAHLYQCVKVPPFNPATQRLRFSFDQQVTGTSSDEIPQVIIGSQCHTVADSSYSAGWWPNYGGNTLFSHSEKPTDLTSFDYHVSQQLAAYQGQTVMIGVSSFDQGAGTITNMVDNIQLRVEGPGCEGVFATDDTDGDGVIDLLDGAPENPNLQVDLPAGLRFNSTGTASTSAYLENTFTQAGNRQVGTYSFWLRSNNEAGGLITMGAAGAGGSQSEFEIRFSQNNVLRVANHVNNSAAWFIETNDSLFASADKYYHVVVAVDTGESVEADRVKLWVDGIQLQQGSGLASVNYPATQGYENRFGLANTINRVGARDGSGNAYMPMAGYLAEVYYLDGAAREANDFAGFNEEGNWAPKAYDMASDIGNSFHLRFQSPTTTMSPSVSGAAFVSDGDTKTLIHSNHAGGANWQTLVDESSTYSWTAYGNAGHSTDESHFGSSSIKFDGSGDYLKASGSWWHLRGNWNGEARTIEMWFNTDSNAFQALASQSANQHYQYLWIKPGCSGLEDCIGIGGNQGGTHAKGKAAITLNTWHHVAHVITADSQSYIFFNGELIDHRSWTNPNGFAGAEHMQIGAQTYYGTSNHRYPFSGYIDEIRYSLTARYLPNAVSGIGADSSPRGNHFTAYNLGAHDVTLDSPLTSFATMNPATTAVVSGYLTFSEGNTKVYSSKAYNKIFTTHSATSGKYYAEAMVHSNGFQYMGVAPEAYVANVGDYTGYLTQNNPHVWALYNSDSGSDGKVYHNGVALEDLGSIGGYTVVHIALDVDNLKVYFGMNGTWSGDPVAGTGGHAITGDRWYFAQGYRDWVTWNFGQDPTFAGEKSGQSYAPTEGPGRYYYQPPAGYKALVDVKY